MQKQRQWLNATLREAKSSILLIGSPSVVLGHPEKTNTKTDSPPYTGYCSGDDWDCYRPAQQNLLGMLARNIAEKPKCVIILTGDYHHADIKRIVPGEDATYSNFYEPPVRTLHLAWLRLVNSHAVTAAAGCESGFLAQSDMLVCSCRALPDRSGRSWPVGWTTRLPPALTCSVGMPAAAFRRTMRACEGRAGLAMFTASPTSEQSTLTGFRTSSRSASLLETQVALRFLQMENPCRLRSPWTPVKLWKCRQLQRPCPYNVQHACCEVRCSVFFIASTLLVAICLMLSTL